MLGMVIVTDGRSDYLERTLASLDENLHAEPETIIVDDSAHTLGLAGAVRKGWQEATEKGWRFLLHWEEDFTLDVPFDPMRLVGLLRRAPSLAQIVLKRQAWSPEEQEAGGIIERDPDAYRETFHGTDFLTFHEAIFSLNPCVIPRNVFSQGWPDGNEAEQTKLMLDQGRRFAFYGRKFAAPLVTHIGARRSVGWAL